MRVFTFREKPDPEPNPSYEEHATLPKGVMSKIVRIRHGAFEVPGKFVPDAETDYDVVGLGGFEPPT